MSGPIKHISTAASSGLTLLAYNETESPEGLVSARARFFVAANEDLNEFELDKEFPRLRNNQFAPRLPMFCLNREVTYENGFIYVNANYVGANPDATGLVSETLEANVTPTIQQFAGFATFSSITDEDSPVQVIGGGSVRDERRFNYYAVSYTSVTITRLQAIVVDETSNDDTLFDGEVRSLVINAFFSLYQIDNSGENFTEENEPLTDPYELLFGAQDRVLFAGELTAEEFISDTSITNKVVIRRTTIRPSYGRSIIRGADADADDAGGSPPLEGSPL